MKNKKSFNTLLVCLVSLFFTSCYPNFNVDDPFYKNKHMNRELKKKTSMGNFSSVESPVVIFYGIDDIQYLPYNKKKTRPVQDGSLCFVFDLQNNKVVDYVYSPNPMSQIAQKRGNRALYNISDRKGYYGLCANGGRIDYTAFNSNHEPFSIVDSENYSPFVVMYDFSYSAGNRIQENYFFVDENNPIGIKTATVSYDKRYYENSFISDVNGQDFYVSEPRVDEFNIYKITPFLDKDIQKVIKHYETKPNSYSDLKHIYKVIGTDSLFVYIAEWNDYSRNLYNSEPSGTNYDFVLHLLSKTGNGEKTVSFSIPRGVEEELEVRELFNVGDESYIVCDIYSHIEKEDYISILKLDNTKSALSFVKNKEVVKYTYSDIFYNENLKRIYFFNTAYSGGITYRYFDIAASSFSNLFTITQDNIVNKS